MNESYTMAAAQGDRPIDAYWYCYSWPGGDPIDPKANPDIVKAFGAFISAKYGPERDNPRCNVRTSEAGVHAMQKDWIAEANKIGKAITTGWKHAP
jgi:hypothetical protein